MLVISALIGILEATPATHIVNQNRGEIRLPVLDIRDQPRQRVATRKAQSASAFIGIGADDFDPAPFGIAADNIGLVLGGVLLVFG
jgi:hypothetical protein